MLDLQQRLSRVGSVYARGGANRTRLFEVFFVLFVAGGWRGVVWGGVGWLRPYYSNAHNTEMSTLFAFYEEHTAEESLNFSAPRRAVTSVHAFCENAQNSAICSKSFDFCAVNAKPSQCTTEASKTPVFRRIQTVIC